MDFKRLVFFLIIYFGALELHAQAREPFVLLELFTSQGCSSCPSADANLTDLLQRKKEKGEAIYLLAFHVDYWDRLGWKDVFSNSDYTERQREYATALNTRTVYTPQMIVNGREAFVGSNKAKTNAAIELALSTPAQAGIFLKKEEQETHIELSVELTDPIPDGRLVVALVEHHVVTKIESGENKGRTIQYDGVVRTMNIAEAAKKLTFSLALPSIVKKENAEIVVFLQDEATHTILAANDVVL